MNHTGVTSVGCDRQAFRKRLSSGVWGNRRLARLGWGDQDRIPFELDPIGGDGERGWTAQDLARLERKHTLMPRTRDRAARGIDGPFRQAGACVGATIRDRVHGALHVEERDRVAAHVHPATRPGREIRERRTGVYPSARVGRRAVAWAEPAPPN